MMNDDIARGFDDDYDPGDAPEGRAMGFDITIDAPFPFNDVTSIRIDTYNHASPDGQVVGSMIMTKTFDDGERSNYTVSISVDGDTRIIAEGITIRGVDHDVITNPWYPVFLVLHALFSESMHDQIDPSDS